MYTEILSKSNPNEISRLRKSFSPERNMTWNMVNGLFPDCTKLKPSSQSIEEQIQIIHRIQLSDFENATMKITDIQSKLQDQIVTQAQEFRLVIIKEQWSNLCQATYVR